MQFIMNLKGQVNQMRLPKTKALCGIYNSKVLLMLMEPDIVRDGI